MVRFFSLLSRLFLLERGAKREKQPPLPDYFCFQVVVVVQTTARGKSFLLSFSDEANSNTTRRIESLGKRFEFSLSLLSLSYSVRKSALFPVLLLSFASFESAFEKSYSVQTPLLLLLLFVVLVFVLLLKNTKHLQLVEREKE